jgi:tetratricopeptide (TPR) repeat protein
VFARVLLVDKSEVLDYTNGPDRDKWDAMPINTDDNAVIEFAAPHDLISFRLFAGYLATIYTSSWRYGHLERVLVGLGEGTDNVENLANQAISLLTNGRKREANRFIEKAEVIDPNHKALEIAKRVFVLLSGDTGFPFVDIEDPSPTPGITEKQIDELLEHLYGVKRALGLHANLDSLERFNRIPDHLWRRGGPQMLFFKGYLHFLNADPEDSSQCEEAIEVLSQLVREHESYVIGHPEIHYYLGLCHDNALHFDKAVKNLKTYVTLIDRREEHARLALLQSRANLELALEGFEGTAPLDLLPDREGAPTTDKPGESPKEVHEP